MGGWTNSTLTPLGITQAKQTAEYLAKSVPTHAFQIFTSDLTRAVQTAEWITEKTGNAFTKAQQLRELNNGVSNGLSKAEAQKIWVSPTEPVLDWIPYDQGESWRMLYSRIATYMEFLASTNIERLITISHANAIICIINWWLGLSSDTHLKNIMYDIRPCSLTYLKRENDGSSRVVKLNDISHLAG
ncbi:putative phosphoserine phosphatase 2 [Pseudovibrio axinellae]|uniref:Putative phosphoserine phosphatase 2 n=1 Tax=Pseudovibrio axinellae TaxID=989403 RepID=A0A165XYI5_9HYPH|nr:putative phosphoserine phosphatase 2 [Pseudovibrio axinellae]SER71979.1 probable phosphoglycerate mutase [Pseudovibrio axinellae]